MTVQSEDVSVGRARRSGSAHHIPVEHYLSTEFLDRETTKLWPSVWQIACREEQLPDVGDYVEYTIADQSILLVRVSPGCVKAYYNACLHRGTQLKEGCGSAAQLRCPFHAWTWNLDGTIKTVTDPDDFVADEIAPERLRLPECQVDTAGGFVFINMDLNAGPLGEYLGILEPELERFEVSKWRLVNAHSAIFPCNWKVAIDAFIEVYHVHCLHPQMMEYWDDTVMELGAQTIHTIYQAGAPGAMGRPSSRLGEYEGDARDILQAILEEMSQAGMYSDEEMEMGRSIIGSVEGLSPGESLRAFLATMRRASMEAKGIRLPAAPDGDVLDPRGWHLFPNVFLGPTVGGGSCMRARPNGRDPDSCVFEVWNLEQAPETELSEKRTPVKVEFHPEWQAHNWGTILTQDFTNMGMVQRGMHSREFRTAICGAKEGLVANFHQVLEDYLAQDFCSQQFE